MANYLNEANITPSSLEQLIDFSEYPLGCTLEEEATIFRFFSPRARRVDLEIFEYYCQSAGHQFKMVKDNSGIWNIRVEQPLNSYLYGFRVVPKDPADPTFLTTNDVIADPYSKEVICRNNFRQSPKSHILSHKEYDWKGDDFKAPSDPRDLIIYEAHIKDMTAHSSSGASGKGYYQKFIDFQQRGGINHLKKLGVNAIEFLPLQKFAYFEPPYQKKVKNGIKNTWNRYSRNHWGYMSSFYFVPEPLYASNGTTTYDKIVGGTGIPAQELKDVIKMLHREEFSVILDVVYNHVSQYDENPLKYADKQYYFRLDSYNEFKSKSGCGNDLKTESPMARRLIIDSIKYWIEEFHIDGFRFDLANLIDRQTLNEIRDEVRAINPNVILIAEPWGGGYDPWNFSHLDYSAWNDHFRNGVKGAHPKFDKGFIFGEYQGDNDRMALENYFRGTIENAEQGLFKKSKHSVNYLESHDGYTLGDFIRIGLNPDMEQTPIKDLESHTQLSKKELRISKLAAIYLFTSQGIVMISEGQEYARSKVIAHAPVKDSTIGYMDHDTYNKDNATNYLNYEHLKLNPSLFTYYQGLIKLRNNAPALRKSEPLDVIFQPYIDKLHITFYVNGEPAHDPFDYFISLNANPSKSYFIDLPEGYWDMIVNGNLAGTNTIATISGSLIVPPSSGVVLRKLRQ